MLYLTKDEWIATIWTARISATFSIIGSSLIIYMIVKDAKEKLQKIHNRLLLVMSCLDILNSSALGSSTAMIPKRLNHLFYGAYGNDATCSAGAFLITLGTAQPMYNSMLCLYYLAIIKYNVSDDVLLKYEKYMHAFAIVPSLSAAILGVSFDLFKPMLLDYCGFYDDCEFQRIDSSYECTPKDTTFTWMVNVITTTMVSFAAIGLVTIIVSMGLIYCSVRKQAIKMRRYSSFQRRNSLNGGEHSKGVHHESMVQSTMYILAYLCTYTWPIVNSFISSVSRMRFLVLYLKAVFFPLQGFWNFITFIRPRYVTIRDKKKDASFWWILKAVVSGKTFDDEPNARRNNQRSSTNKLKSSRLDVIQRANGQKQERQQQKRKSAVNFSLNVNPVTSPTNNNHSNHVSISPTTIAALPPGTSPNNNHNGGSLGADKDKHVTATDEYERDIEEVKEEISPPDYSNGSNQHDMMYASNEPANDHTHHDRKKTHVPNKISPLFANETETPTSHYGLETNLSDLSDSSFVAQEIIEDMIEDARNT